MDPAITVPIAGSIPADDAWIMVLFCGLAVVAGFFGWLAFVHKARLIEDTPTSKIRSAAQGCVEIKGIGQSLGPQALVSPMTGLSCLWWECEVHRREERGSGRNRRTSWRRISHRISDEPFWLEDDTGRCVVNPHGAEVHAQVDVWYGNTPWPRLDSRRHKSVFGFAGGRYRYREKRLPAGHALYALGFFQTQRGQDGFDRKAQVRDLLVEWKQDPEALVRRFDANSDGQVDAEEWEATRAAAQAEVEAEFLSRGLEPDVHVLRKSDDRRPFLLSVFPEHKLTRRYRLGAIGCLLAFFGGLAGLVLLLPGLLN
ncbi:MAG: GIDE domain-containing protein [Pseudomonadota bacterium]|nr:GIDE domain-containing protein [Pseudomonadota bacterium]